MCFSIIIAGFTVSDLKDLYSISEFRGAGVGLAPLREHRYSLFELSSVFTLKDFKDHGVHLSELMRAKTPGGQWLFSYKQLLEESYSYRELYRYGIPIFRF